MKSRSPDATAGAAFLEGLPSGGALTMGASFSGVGLAFLGIAALAGQLAQTSRGANGLAVTVLGIAYLLRAAGDLTATHDVASGISWASPIGWAQAMRSYGENNWWPFLLLAGVPVVLCLVSLCIESTRDLGSGLLPDRPGAVRASALTVTPVGLTLRLQRWSILGWSVGIIVGSLFFGTVATAMSNLLNGKTAIAAAFLGRGGQVLTVLMGYFTMAEALLVAAFVLQSIVTLRTEEADGGAELQWSGALSRMRWAASRMIVPAVASGLLLFISGLAEGASFGAASHDPSAAWRYAGLSLAYWPTMLLVIAVLVLCTGWIPRAAITVSWIAYGAVVLVSLFGGILKLPDWVADHTPFTAIEDAANGALALPIILIAAVAVVLTGLGLLRLRRRDLVAG
jgi:ABC-2 type transport system permease protein